MPKQKRSAKTLIKDIKRQTGRKFFSEEKSELWQRVKKGSKCSGDLW